MFVSCNISNRNSKQSDHTTHKKPEKKWVNPDSLVIKVPGEGLIKKPEIINSQLPKKNEYFGVYKTKPGISFLEQSVAEKLADEPLVLSKKPQIVKFDDNKHDTTFLVNGILPDSVYVLKELFLGLDSVPKYKDLSVVKGLVSIDGNDTIFPPVSVFANKPIRTEAKPFYYKENTVLDLSILESHQNFPNPFIRSIDMDNKDIIWFGSHTGGLISYDGEYFDQYIFPRMLTKETGLSMLIDSKGNIWYGTKGGGVFCFDGTYITQYTKAQGLLSNNITDILEDHKGNLWFASSTGISMLNDSVFIHYTSENGLGDDNVFSIFEDNEGDIWAGTFGGGVSKFDGKGFVTYNMDDGLCNNIVLSICQDNNGNMWFGTNGGGVSKFTGESFTNYSIDQGLGGNVILAILEDSDSNMWFGTYGDGLTYFDGESFSNFTTEDGLSENYIRTIVEDKDGNLWIGTDGAGVSKINIRSFKYYTKNQGLLDNNVTSMYQDNMERLCFAPFNDGVMIFDKLNEPGQLESFFHFNSSNGLAHDIVIAINQDSLNNYWFGTYEGGVSKLDMAALQSGKLNFTNFDIESGLNSNIVRDIHIDHLGNIWFGTNGGLTKYTGHEFISYTKRNGLGEDMVLSIYQDDSDALWIGTMDGGVSYLSGDSITVYNTEHGLAGNTVWATVQDENGIVWFGTNNGLSGFDGKQFITIDSDLGLSNNKVFSMIIDEKNTLWVGTIKGLTQILLPDSSLFNQSVSSFPEMINYGRLDGLIGLDFSANSVLLDNMNCIWWGTDRALTMLDLTTFSAAEEAPIIHVNSIYINNKVIDFQNLKINNQHNKSSGIVFNDVLPFLHNPTGLSLPSNQNHLTFKFSATDWSSSNQVQYQYMLVGFDNSWSLQTREKTADYRNIPPGSYKFIVRAKGKSGLWSNGYEIPFKVRWPIYLKWWAILLYVVVFVFLIWTIIKWRVSIIERQKLILEDMVGNRTKALDKALVLAKQAAEAKSQFIATISHEIRTPLNAIMGLTHLAVSSTVDAKQEDYLQKIDRSAVTLLTLINEILDFSKIEAGKMKLENVNFDLELVINTVIVLNSQAALEKDLEFAINISPDIPQKLIGDPLRLGQIITNLCNNAIKFTSSGEVVIDIEVEEELSSNELYLQVAVKDTGIGISDDQLPFLFDKFSQADSSITRNYGGTGLGLSISKLLIEMMDGQIWLESEINKGTTFFFDVKVGVQDEQPKVIESLPDELLGFDILICDDNLSTLKSLEAALGSYSLKIRSTSSGEEALEILKSKPYDLLIIDSKMKGISGLDTIMSIRSSNEIQPLKTILITDSLSSKTNFEQNITGIDGYITKPTTSSVMIKEILSVFGMERSRDKEIDVKQAQLKLIGEALSGKQILLAEDNAINRQVVSELTDKVGVKVDYVINGVEVLGKVLQKKYDLILMDLHMPIMDGFNASAQIKDHDIQTPIVAITADAMHSVKDKCDEVGIVDVIIKPIDPALFYSKLVKWISPKSVIPDIDSKPNVAESLFANISINVLDVSGGVSRFGDDVKLYTKMLKKFILSNAEICNEIMSLLNEHDYYNAQIKAHSLKGESGNIGAVKVAKFAANIEQLILKHDTKGVEKNIDQLENSISELSKSLESYFNGINLDKDLENSSIPDIINKIIDLLEHNDPRVFDYLDSLAISGIAESDYMEIEKIINEKSIKESITLIREILVRL